MSARSSKEGDHGRAVGVSAAHDGEPTESLVELADERLLHRPTEIVAELYGEALQTQAVRPHFQPLVALDTGAVVGYEALTRGPTGTSLESPVALFEAARRAGRMTELDRACRNCALATAYRVGVGPPLTVFVNVEPETVRWPLPASRDETWLHAPGELRCCIEVTERALTSRPAELLRAISEVRELSWGVALDDVGVSRHSLALMPFLRPDVVKLDLGLIQGQPSGDVAEVVNAVAAQTEQTGAAVLAEGIETEAHLETALALGATLGQGYLFGRPGPLAEHEVEAGRQLRFLGGNLPRGGPTPFSLVQTRHDVRRGRRAMLEALAGHLEDQGRAQGETAIVLACDHSLDASRLARLAELAEHAALVGAVGRDLLPEPAGRVRGAAMGRDDPLAVEWVMAVVSPHFAAALVGRAVGAIEPEPDQVFEFAVTHDRRLAVDCARSLMARLPALAGRDEALEAS